MRSLKGPVQSMDKQDTIDIEVAYARPDRQRVISVRVQLGTAPGEVLRLSKLAEDFPEIEVASCRLGVFGRVIADDYGVKAGDRIEIYRPLIADPKDVRRRRARGDKQ